MRDKNLSQLKLNLQPASGNNLMAGKLPQNNEEPEEGIVLNVTITFAMPSLTP